MNDSYSTYTDRVLQPTPVIMGLKLLPFTLGHSMILKRAKSEFMVGSIESLQALNNNAMILELVFAIMVCSTTYDELQTEIHNGNFNNEVKKYFKFIRKQLNLPKYKWQMWLRRIIKKLFPFLKDKKPFFLVAEVKTFLDYIKAGTSAPSYEVNKTESDIQTNPIEPEEAIISTLMTDCGFSRSECLNLPLSETLSAYLLYAYKQGTIDLLSKEVVELMKPKAHGKS